MAGDKKSLRKTPSRKVLSTYEPTFQLEPFVKFSSERVEKTMKEIVDGELADYEYDDDSAREKCLSLAGNLMKTVKEFNFDRYKIIALVSIGQQRQQSVSTAHLFLWDADRDNYASYVYDHAINQNIFCTAVVYGVYLD